MNRDEAVKKFVDSIADLLLEAIYSERTGGERSQWNRLMYQKVHVQAGLFYDLLRPPVPPDPKPQPANRQTGQPAKKVQ